MYFILALIPLLISRNFVKQLKIETKGKLNTNIQLCYVNEFLSFLHMFMCVDPAGWAGRLPFWLVAFFQGLSASCAYLVCVILVTSWIAIIDGGKSRKPPKWAVVTRNVCVASMFLHDCALCVVEVFVGDAADDLGAIDGTTNAVKSGIFIVLILVYFQLTIRYALKITKTLRGGGNTISREEVSSNAKCDPTKRAKR